MTKKPDIPKARKAAQALLKKHAIKTFPVPVERIAKAMGVRVQYAPLDGDLSGFAHIREGVPIAGANTLHAPTRQRFTLAHELAHIELHRPQIESSVHVDRGSLRRDALASAGTAPNEMEANAFAAELLIPTDLLKQTLDGRAIDLEDDERISALAKRFKVSEAAMRFRLDSFTRDGA